MRIKITALALAAALLAGLLAGCGDTPAENYPGEFDTPYSLGDQFTINITDDTEVTRYRYVVCTVTLEIGDSGFAATLDERIYRVRGIVINTISEKKVSQVAGHKEALAAEILERLNEEFGTDTIHRLDFSDFYFYS